ncbi:hypothetical protein B566_EDAN011328 [Ephemera danica]|nr:hypothetical protein B566_EDAN011328 [Ephemera danica]
MKDFSKAALDPTHFRMTTKLSLSVAMVRTGPQNSNKTIPAWVVLVSSTGEEVYSTKIKPQFPVMDYCSDYTGLRTGDLDNGKSFEEVQLDVGRLIKNRLLIGHHLDLDLFMLDLKHPEYYKRDTAKYEPFMRRYGGGGLPSLKVLAIHELDRDPMQIQQNPLHDARLSMALYMKYKW